MSDRQQQGEILPSGATFADRLNYLFDTRLSPSGRPFTNKEVSVASGGKLSAQYISKIRHGLVVMPGLERLHALASVFAVPIEFFFGGKTPAAPMDADSVSEDDLLRTAMEHPIMRDIIVESREYSDDEWAVLLDMMRYARAVIARGRAQGDGS